MPEFSPMPSSLRGMFIIASRYYSLEMNGLRLWSDAMKNFRSMFSEEFSRSRRRCLRKEGEHEESTKSSEHYWSAGATAALRQEMVARETLVEIAGRGLEHLSSADSSDRIL